MNYELFQNPGPAYRGKPFWSWNGELDKEELIRQIHVLKDMGFGGFFMHSRTGLITEYLGDEWFELINACADEAQKLGMEAWLYDEDRWPSGSGGGLVTEKMENRTKYLRVREKPAAEFQNDAGMVAAFAARMDGINVEDYKRIHTQEEAAGYDTVLEFEMVYMDPASFYNGFTYLDTINKNATDDFIKITHEKYKEKCGDRLGKSIKGIFTDEPHHGSVIGGFGLSNPERNHYLPYTYDMLDQFKDMFGYDMAEKLPELYYRYKGEKIAPIKWQYMELLQQLFLKNFVGNIEEWCHKNKMILTGHFLHEDSLACQSIPFGSLMRGYEIMDYPGVDVLSEGNYQYNIAKQLQSVSRQVGKKWLLSELYGCTGWQMNFQSHKAVGDWQALYGINLRCPHLSWYTMEGEAKRDYPASILHQSTWYKEYARVEDYFARLGTVLMEGTPCCDVLYVTPVESLWAEVGIGWANGLSVCFPELQQVEATYRNIWNWLMHANTDFDFGDEEMMSRLARVEKREDGAVLIVGNAEYRQVLISGMLTMRATTLNLLKEFKEAGGRIVFAGDAPAYIDAVSDNGAKQLAESAVNVPVEKDAIVEALSQNASSIVRADNSDILMQVRRDGEKLIVVLINDNRKEKAENVTVTIDKSGYVQQWDAFTGNRYACGKDDNGTVTLRLTFAPSQEFIFVVTPEDEALPQKEEITSGETVILDKVVGYELDELNICVLDMASLKIADGPWEPKAEILQIDRKLRQNYGMALRGGEMIQPWYAGKTEHEKKDRISLKFDFTVEDIPTSQTWLVMERPTYFEVSVNGKAVDTSRQDGWWVDNCFIKLPLEDGMLQTGKNEIVISVVFDESINLEALYLIGDFGVTVNGFEETITKLPETVTIGQLYEQGLPFYTGKITYKFEAPKMDGKVKVELGDFQAACAVINPSSEHAMIPWMPYETVLESPEAIEVQLVLTRRNTFGPLHQTNLYAPNYGPGNWHTGGADWTDNHNFYPSGLFAFPKLTIQK